MHFSSERFRQWVCLVVLWLGGAIIGYDAAKFVEARRCAGWMILWATPDSAKVRSPQGLTVEIGPVETRKAEAAKEPAP